MPTYHLVFQTFADMGFRFPGRDSGPSVIGIPEDEDGAPTESSLPVSDGTAAGADRDEDQLIASAHIENTEILDSIVNVLGRMAV